jgi:AcrR family transcriptional regulator
MRRVPVLTLRQLEAASGEPRTTIYYYLHRGLLPRPQKTPSGRSLYPQDLAAILKDIAALREAGLSLLEIEQRLRSKVLRAGEIEVDLVAQEYERMHNRILAAAAHEFAAKGYKKTHVKTIYENLGISVNVFYDHFPSKRAVLAGCLVEFMKWSLEFVDRNRGRIEDPAEELLWLAFASFPVFQLGEAWRGVIHVDAPDKDHELYLSIAAARAGILERIMKALAASGPPRESPGGISDRLIAEGLFGATTMLFGSFNSDRFSTADLMRANLWFTLAAIKERAGKNRVGLDCRRYEELIEYFSGRMPPPPPIFQEAEEQ